MGSKRTTKSPKCDDCEHSNMWTMQDQRKDDKIQSYDEIFCSQCRDYNGEMGETLENHVHFSTCKHEFGDEFISDTRIESGCKNCGLSLESDAVCVLCDCETDDCTCGEEHFPALAFSKMSWFEDFVSKHLNDGELEELKDKIDGRLKAKHKAKEIEDSINDDGVNKRKANSYVGSVLDFLPKDSHSLVDLTVETEAIATLAAEAGAIHRTSKRVKGVE